MNVGYEDNGQPGLPHGYEAYGALGNGYDNIGNVATMPPQMGMAQNSYNMEQPNPPYGSNYPIFGYPYNGYSNNGYDNNNNNGYYNGFSPYGGPTATFPTVNPSVNGTSSVNATNSTGTPTNYPNYSYPSNGYNYGYNNGYNNGYNPGYGQFGGGGGGGTAPFPTLNPQNNGYGYYNMFGWKK